MTAQRLERGDWEYRISPLEGPVYRYAVFLSSGFLMYGGWCYMTYRGARRKAERELRLIQKRESRRARRLAWIHAHAVEP